MVRPSYSSSRLYLWLSFVGAWAVILLLAIGALLGVDQAVSFGAIALPTMFGIITGNLAVHRGFGSADFRAQARETQPPYHARDKPDEFAEGAR